MKKLNFKNLGSDPIYRSAPFWAWNSVIEPDEVRRQIRIMHDMHMGGFFIHSRAGLATEYLGKEWFKCVKAAVDEAEKLNMYANLYDEDRWPSGIAGGAITQEKKFRMRYLEFYDAAAPLPCAAEDITLNKVYILTLSEHGEVIAYRKAGEAPEAVAPQEKLVRLIVRIAPSSENYNNGSYLDTTDPDAVRAFIDSTYEKYFSEFGKKFGKSIPYFFTDEPNYLDLAAANRRPWSERLMELFAAEKNQDLTDFLPELFWKCGKDFSEIRYWFYRTMTGLFAGTFMKMLGEWCGKHNIKLTGHLLREDTLSQQIHAIGAAMPGYEYMQAPGIDVLTANWTVLNTAKQLHSVARQLGKKQLLSETYGCTGWDFPLAGHKVLGDWQYACGINFRCQHLYWYSMLGCSKRDYPASIGGQSPWYKAHAPLEKYFARLGELFSKAENRAELLVLHPIETMWGYAADYDKAMSFNAEYDRMFDRLARELLGSHLDFDYGDESLLAKYAKINGSTFIVGETQYKTVLIPEVETLRSSTVELLEHFVNNKGKVCYLGKTPDRIDGNVDQTSRLTELYKKFEFLPQDKFAGILRQNSSDCSITSTDGKEAASVILRSGVIDQQHRIVFAVNMGCTFENQQAVPDLTARSLDLKDLQLKVPAEPGKTVCQLDLFTGDLSEMEFEYSNNAYCFKTDLPALESKCFVIADKTCLPTVAIAGKISGKKAVEVSEKPAALSENNLLVLDHAQAYSNGKLVADFDYILNIDNKLRTLHGLALRSNKLLQPWFDKKGSKSFPATLKYEFYCEEIPRDAIQLIMEEPEQFTITLNGDPVSNQSSSFWCDRALKCVALPGKSLLEGKNILQLDLLYHEDFTGLESICLSGKFGVKNQNTLVAAPEICSGLPLKDQLLPFYSGNTVYNFEFELDSEQTCEAILSSWQGVALGITWDLHAEELFYTLPGNQRSVCKLAAGKHTLQVTVYGNRRNAFGPFYCNQRPSWVGPYEFSLTEKSEKDLIELGLFAKPEINIISYIYR